MPRLRNVYRLSAGECDMSELLLSFPTEISQTHTQSTFTNVKGGGGGIHENATKAAENFPRVGH